jgi:2'-5' RNA ligase
VAIGSGLQPASRLDPFDLVWDAFSHAMQTADGRHDTPYWRDHAGSFVACVIRVPADRLQPELETLRRDMSGLTGVRLHPSHFLHVMLQELGFLVASPARPDELNSARLEEFAHATASAVADLAPFTIEIGGANSFEDAVFLEVHPSEPVGVIHERIFDLAAIPLVPAYPYLPHCTIGHYDGTVPAPEAAAVLTPWRDAICGEFAVSEIEIVTLDPSTSYPELESYAVIPFGA